MIPTLDKKLPPPAVTEPRRAPAKSEPAEFSRFPFCNCRIGEEHNTLDVTDYEGHIYRTLRIQEIQTPQLPILSADITLRDRNVIVDHRDRFHYKLGIITNGF
jgi:hypothetical protein